MRRAIAAGTAFLVAGCSGGFVEVDDPFYLTDFGEPPQPALVRCLEGPGEMCAIDALPGPAIAAAGANGRYVTIKRHAGGSCAPCFYYIERLPDDRRGFADQRIIGPLDADQFESAKRSLGLPEFTVNRER
jgi:hypothetical protein